MNRKITEERFEEIKKFLNTPILVKPSVSYVADEFGYSSGTIAAINRFDSYKEYRDWQHKRQNEYSKRYLANEMAMIAQERELAAEEIDKFNNEWFFGDEE
jgi:hypothetical protein